MVERVRNDIADGVRWRCRRCKTSKSIRDGSFFSKSKLSLQKWLILIFWWSQDYPVTDAKTTAEVDIGTAVDVYRWLREVCSTKLLGMTIQLGGPGVVVQIDESLFRHKPKVQARMCNYRVDTTKKIHRILSYSTTEDEQVHKRCGCLVWWTHRTHQHLDTWKLFNGETLPHFFPSFRLIQHQEPSSTQMIGGHTVE